MFFSSCLCVEKKETDDVSLSLNNFRSGKTPESDSIMNALNVFEREGELVSYVSHLFFPD